LKIQYKKEKKKSHKYELRIQKLEEETRQLKKECHALNEEKVRDRNDNSRHSLNMSYDEL